MDAVTFSPAVLNGTVAIPPSKSVAHRAILCAALSKGTCTLSPIAPSADMHATVGCIRALGAQVEWNGDSLFIDATNFGNVSSAELDCGESGSTLRFLIPICAALGVESTLTGHGRLVTRPVGCYEDCLPQNGAPCHSTGGGLPFSVSGALRGGVYSLPGNISSQFITGLLFALPILPEDSDIRLTSPLESAGYVDLTIQILEEFGVSVQPTETGWKIPGGQKYLPRDFTVEGDWSQAAFFLAAGALGSNLRLIGLRKDSLQGDKACAELFAAIGATIRWDGDDLLVSPGTRNAFQVDASQIPDLVPILALTAAYCDGTSQIFNAARLRLKESDRLASSAAAINALGGNATETSDGLQIAGQPLNGGNCHGANDHRIVMAVSVAALCCKDSVTVTDAWSIRKSYPNYYEEYQRLGGVINVFHMGESH